MSSSSSSVKSPAAFLLGQVEVAVGDAAEQDRHARGTSSSAGGRGGKPTERGSLARSWRRSGRASRISTPRMPRPRGSSPIAACSLGVDARGDEALERLSARVDHAERCVPGAGELRRGLDELLEERVERELGVECDPRLDERPQPLGDVGTEPLFDRGALCCVQERRSGRRASAASSSRPPSCEVDVRRARAAHAKVPGWSPRRRGCGIRATADRRAVFCVSPGRVRTDALGVAGA